MTDPEQLAPRLMQLGEWLQETGRGGAAVCFDSAALLRSQAEQERQLRILLECADTDFAAKDAEIERLREELERLP